MASNTLKSVHCLRIEPAVKGLLLRAAAAKGMKLSSLIRLKIAERRQQMMGMSAS